jgi:hypothetical protein
LKPALFFTGDRFVATKAPGPHDGASVSLVIPATGDRLEEKLFSGLIRRFYHYGYTQLAIWFINNSFPKPAAIFSTILKSPRPPLGKGEFFCEGSFSASISIRQLKQTAMLLNSGLSPVRKFSTFKIRYSVFDILTCPVRAQ